MSESTPKTNSIEAIKAAIIEDISEATWAKIRQVEGLKIYLVGPDDDTQAVAATSETPKKRAKAPAQRHISDDEWHAMHP